MRIMFTAGLWSLAAWVGFSMTAFALGLPTQATPLVAAAVAVVVAGLLVRRRSIGVGKNARLIDAALIDA